MKPLKIKGLLMLIMIASASFISAKSPASNLVEQGDRFKAQRQEMRTNLELIWKQNQVIQYWKDQLKEDRALGSRADVVFAKGQIVGAKATRAEAKENVSQLKKEFNKKYDALIEHRKLALKESKSDLRLARAEIRKSDQGRSYGGYSAREAAVKKAAVLERESYDNCVELQNVKQDEYLDKQELRHEIRKWNN